MRAIYTGSLDLGIVTIPIGIYKAVDEFKIAGHLYHIDDSAKVGKSSVCSEGTIAPELHEEPVVSFSAVEVADKLVPIDAELRNNLLDRKAPLQIISTHRVSSLAYLLSNDLIVPIGRFQLLPARINDPTLSTQHNAYTTLMERLRVKQMFMLCSVGIAGMDRWAILLSNGAFYPLTYREELRNFPTVDGEIDRPLSRYIDNYLTEFHADFPDELTLEPIRKRVAKFFADLTKPEKKPRSGKKKQLAGSKVSV